MRPLPGRNLCLAGCASIAAHLALIALVSRFPTDFQPYSASTGTIDVRLGKPEHAVPRSPERTPDTRDETFVPRPVGMEPPPPQAERPLEPSPVADAPPEVPNRQAILLSAVDETAWPHFPNLEPGTFELELIITASGHVLAVIPRCEPPFCEAADAFAGIVRQWMFRAAERQGEPVASRMRIEFQINQPPPRSEAQPARQ